MSRKISRSFINGRTGAGTAGQGIKVEWDSTNDGELHWLDVSESSLEAVVDGDIAVYSGVFNSYVDTMDYITITSTGNATDFGNMTVGKDSCATTANGGNGRGLHFMGRLSGGTETNIIEYITINTPGNATDFGDCSSATYNASACSNGINDRGVVSLGIITDGNDSNVLEYVTISSTGNATDFGDMTVLCSYGGGTSNGINDRGIILRGNSTGGGVTFNNHIEYITISSTGNSTDFGDLTEAKHGLSGTTSNGTSDRAVVGGGVNSSAKVNVIEYFTISSTGNATDFGDLSNTHKYVGAASNGTGDRAVWSGGFDATVNVMEYVTISSTGNATDFGDSTASGMSQGVSNAGGN